MRGVVILNHTSFYLLLIYIEKSRINIISDNDLFNLSECKDDIPSTCSFENSKTCQEIVETVEEIDVCEEPWADSGFCDITTPGLVKDTCRRSCGTCGEGKLAN